MAKRSRSNQDDLFGDRSRLRAEICSLAAELGAQPVRAITLEAVRRGFWADDDNEALLVKAHLPDVEQALRVEDKAGLPQFAPRSDGSWVQRVLFTQADYEYQIFELVRQVKNDQRRIRKWQAEVMFRYGAAVDISSIYRDDELDVAEAAD